MYEQETDQQLLGRVLNERNPDCFALLYDRHVKQIYRFVYFKVSGHQEAEDITSEVFLRTWQYLQDKPDIKSFRGLLYRIARNCVIDLYRAKSARPEQILGPESEVGDSGQWLTSMHLEMENSQLVNALGKLKQDYREILTLYYIDELSVAEVAELMGKGRVAVRVTLHRAVKKLQSLLGE